MRNMFIQMTVAVALGAMILFHAPDVTHAVVLKYATIIPDGGPGTAQHREMFSTMRRETGGEIDVKVYAGGVAGDEADIIRKMKVGRIHIGAFTGNGLGSIVPEIRVLECPGLFVNDQEEDYVKARMFDDFAEAFEKNGFVLLGLGGGGTVYLFFPKPVTDPQEFGQFKMWTWKGDPLAQMCMEGFGLNTIPLHIADVNTALDTGMIDSYYVIPAGATSLQWYTRVRYMIDYPVTVVTGAILMHKPTFDLLPEPHGRIVKRAVSLHMDDAMKAVRKMNDDAMDIIKRAGVQILTPPQEQLDEYNRMSIRTIEKSIAKGFFSQAAYQKVVMLIEEYRASRK